MFLKKKTQKKLRGVRTALHSLFFLDESESSQMQPSGRLRLCVTSSLLVLQKMQLLLKTKMDLGLPVLISPPAVCYPSFAWAKDITAAVPGYVEVYSLPLHVHVNVMSKHERPTPILKSQWDNVTSSSYLNPEEEKLDAIQDSRHSCTKWMPWFLLWLSK